MKVPKHYCYYCNKEIKSKILRLTVPPNYLIITGIDFIKAWHPSCYSKSKKKALLELKGGK